MKKALWTNTERHSIMAAMEGPAPVVVWTKRMIDQIAEAAPRADTLKSSQYAPFPKAELKALLVGLALPGFKASQRRNIFRLPWIVAAIKKHKLVS